MRLNLIIVLVAIAVSVAVYFASGGRFIFFALPLLFGLPFLAALRPRAGAPGRRTTRSGPSPPRS